MAKCNRCGRVLKRSSESGYGPVCQIAVLGRKPRPVAEPTRTARRDESTPDLFAVELACAELIGSISLEMPA